MNGVFEETEITEVIEKKHIEKIKVEDDSKNLGSDNENLPTMWSNFKQIHSNAIPCLVSCVISEMQLQLNLMFIGRYSEDTFMLAGVGMANMIINVGCMSIVYGMTSVLETLVSQAHGSK